MFGHLECCIMSTTGERFERAVAIMARLRAPDGCPWDREQTFDSIKPYTVEETYEVLEAIDNRDWSELPGELGDLLLQVLFYSQMASEEQKFTIDDVLDRLAEKLIHRHPHVFSDTVAATSAEVLRNWEQLKEEEKQARASTNKTASSSNGGHKDSGADINPKSILSDVSSAMPALLEARKLSSRVARVGFDWPDVTALLDKLGEETEELKRELADVPSRKPSAEPRDDSSQPYPEVLRARLEEELGDMFFVLVNIARYLALDPESSLKRTNRKFRQRFQWMEERLHHTGRTPENASMDELENLWQQAKQPGLKPQ
jgi:MazG family protein